MAIWAVKLRRPDGGRWRWVSKAGDATTVRVDAHAFESRLDARRFAGRARDANPGWIYLEMPITADLGN